MAISHVMKMKSLNGRGVVAMKNPVIVEWFEVAQKFKGVNINAEVSESIIHLLNGKALGVSQVAFRLRISHEKARQHLFYLWKNGYILRSKYPKERQLEFMAGANPVTMRFYTYTVTDGAEKVPFITFEGWIKQKKDGVC